MSSLFKVINYITCYDDKANFRTKKPLLMHILINSFPLIIQKSNKESVNFLNEVFKNHILKYEDEFPNNYYKILKNNQEKDYDLGVIDTLKDAIENNKFSSSFLMSNKFGHLRKGHLSDFEKLTFLDDFQLNLKVK
jgi:hypothetical protein